MVNLGKITHSYSSEIIAPTCTTGGYTTHTCTVCGDTYKDNEINALGHNYKYVGLDNSEHIKKCSNCNDTKDQEPCNFNTYIDSSTSTLDNSITFVCDVYSNSKTAVAARSNNSGNYRYYTKLEDAVGDSELGSSSTIYLFNSYTLNTDLTIPNGYKLVITWIGFTGSEDIAMLTDADYSAGSNQDSILKPATYLKTKLTVNGTITNYGTILVQGLLKETSSVNTGNTSGHYAEIELLENSIIDMQANSSLSVKGYITGEGRITTNSAKIYSPFVIRDWRGGSNAMDIYETVSAFNVYNMSNIQCECIISNNSYYYGYVHLYTAKTTKTVSKKVFVTVTATVDIAAQHSITTVPIISYDSSVDNLLLLTESTSYVKINYEEQDSTVNDGMGITNLTVYGSAKLGSFKITAKVGNATITSVSPSSLKYVIEPVVKAMLNDTNIDTSIILLPLSWNFNIIFNAIANNNNIFAVDNKLKLMPGAKVTVNEGYTLKINAETFVHNNDLELPYSISPTYYTYGSKHNVFRSVGGAILTIKGTMEVNAKFGGTVYGSAGGKLIINTYSAASSIEKDRTNEVYSGSLNITGPNNQTLSKNTYTWDATNNCWGQ